MPWYCWVLVTLEVVVAFIFYCLVAIFERRSGGPKAVVVLLAATAIGATVWFGNWKAESTALAEAEPEAAANVTAAEKTAAAPAQAGAENQSNKFDWTRVRDEGPFWAAIFLAILALLVIIGECRSHDFDDVFLLVIFVIAALHIGQVVPWMWGAMALWVGWPLLAWLVLFTFMVFIDRAHFAAAAAVIGLLLLQGTGVCDVLGWLGSHKALTAAALTVWFLGIFPSGIFEWHMLLRRTNRKRVLEIAREWLASQGMPGSAIPSELRPAFARHVAQSGYEDECRKPVHSDRFPEFLDRAIYWPVSGLDHLFTDLIPEAIRVVIDTFRPWLDKMIRGHNAEVLAQLERASEASQPRKRSRR